MGLKKYKPVTPGQRFKVGFDFNEITRDKPYKKLTTALKKSGGRNNYGHITVRFRGGGHKRKYRIIDFKRNKHDVPGTVASIEYDPNRTARIALIKYRDGEWRYILAPEGITVDQEVMASRDKVEIVPGNATQLKNIPSGTMIHNLELKPGRGGQVVRSAGAYAVLSDKESGTALIKMPSGEMRKFQESCFATIGQLGNIDNKNIKEGKAGRTRWMGRRGHTRGSVMNPVDHPHGGGEGKSKGGRNPVTPWGKPTLGYKTRKKKKPSNKYIVKRRK